MTNKALKIVLCICTYRRPEGLKKLLNSLPALDNIPDLEVVVADNHQEREGIAVCKSLPAEYPFLIHTVSATEPGISAARNAATAEALRQAPDLVAFLDDDEWPESQWLAELLRIQQRHGADLVGGPTRPVFPSHADMKLRENAYYGADMQLADGAACVLQAGGNFLIKAEVLKPFAPDFFHPAFAHSGGEDLAFFMQLQQHGYSMHWAANAIVHEPVPDSRLDEGWMRRRIITIHNSRVRVMQLLQPGLSHSVVRGLKTCALGAVAVGSSCLAWLSPAHREKAQQLRWKFMGKFTAHMGKMTVRNETY